MPRIRKSAHKAVSALWMIALYIRLSKEDWKDEAKAASQKGSKKEEPQEALDMSRSIVKQSKMPQEYVEAHFQDNEYVIVDTYPTMD